ncbi:MAG: hypothetical protein C4617_04420 [Candidatus Liberibacter europaeus]|uniref:Uncharacterized protein n=1 Tax=Candidatus Liberibacter europaeus TaxID=744859 RepID=A0A2T4VWV3_9HYPH|nr:hypothetical protein [Candidatus Liberibacter europaeus]PTL86256.1 MAG: hypothetical protein C4617_04420 [Candidatus Liberibacter europaeus]
MKKKCIDLLNKVAGRKLAKEEIRDLEGSILQAHKNFAKEEPATFNKMNKEERTRYALKKAIEDKHEQFAKNFERKITEKRKQADFVKIIHENGKEGELTDIFAQRIFHENGSIGVSVENKIEAETTKYMSGLSEAIKNYGDTHYGFLQDPSKHELIVKEIWGEHTGDKTAKEIADGYKKVGDEVFARAERSGLAVTKRDRYVSQPANPEKVLIRGKEGFIDDVIGDLDMNEYRHIDGEMFSEEEMRDFVGEAWETIAHGGRNKPIADAKYSRSNFGGIGSFKKERQLNFVNADAQLRYLKLYGQEGTPIENLNNSFKRLVRSVVWSEELGSDPETYTKNLLNSLVVKDREVLSRDPQALKLLQKRESTINSIMDVMFHGENVGNSHWANYMATLRGFQSITKLGFHLIPSLEDIPFVAMGLKKNGLELGEGLKRFDKSTIQNAQLFWEGISAGSRRYQEGNHGSGIMRRSNELLHKASGVSFLDRSLKESITLPILNTIGKLTKKYKSLNEFRSAEGNIHAGIFEHGEFTKDHWHVTHLAERDVGPHGDYHIVNHKLIQDIDPKRLVPYIENEQIRKGALESRGAFETKIQEMHEVLEKNTKAFETKKNLEHSLESNDQLNLKIKIMSTAIEKEKQAFEAKWSTKKSKGKLKAEEKHQASISDKQGIVNALKSKRIERLKAESKHQAFITNQKGRIEFLKKQRENFLLEQAQILKDETSKQIYAILQKERQTWARGASGAGLLDKKRLGLLDAPAGTIPGELLRFLLQFKLTPYSMFRSFMFDLPRSAKHYSDLGIPLSPWEIRAKYISVLMISNLVADQLKHLAKFEEPPPIFSVETALKAIAGIAPLGLNAMVNTGGRSDSGTIAKGIIGPSFSMGVDLVSIFKGAQAGENVSKKLARFISGNIPGGNLPYVVGAKKKLITDNIIEHLGR